MEMGNLASRHGFCDTVEEQELELPPGFRFHPTDEELITHYLSKKIADAKFDPKAIGVVDLNKCEPWDLPKRAKLGEKEWYFFCVRDRKYPTGLRTNRATVAGYWKATGKDKEIFRDKQLVGMKKTLVFYKGRAPRGQKSQWVMHEFRLEGKNSMYSFAGATKNEWAISRVYQKNLIGNLKKDFGTPAKLSSSYSSELMEIGLPSPTLPPLMDIPAHVTCFSNIMEGQKAQDLDLSRLFSPAFQSPDTNFSDNSSFFFFKYPQNTNSASFPSGFMNLLECDLTAKQGCKLEKEISPETVLICGINPEISSGNEIGRNNFDQCIWNY